MDRRTLLTATFAVIASSVAGCLGTQNTMDNSNDPKEGEETTDTETNDSADGGGPGTTSTLEPDLEILNIEYTGDSNGSASVAFEDHTVAVTGTILGSNSCYTARLDAVRIDDQTLLVQIESFEETAKHEDCRAATVEIEYEMNVEIPGALPAAVRVEHNGEHVMTDHAP
jgi:hypothetical protein